MNQSSACFDAESEIERNGKPPFFGVNTMPSTSMKSSGFGAEITKIFNRISRRGDSKGIKSNSEHRKKIHLPQLLIIPSRRHSTSNSSYSKKFSLLIPIQKSNTAPADSYSKVIASNHGESFSKSAARPRSFSVTQDISDSNEGYGRGSYFQGKRGIIRRGFGGIYRRSALPVHAEDVFTPEEEELFEVQKPDEEEESIADDTITSDNTSNASTLVEKCRVDDDSDDCSCDTDEFCQDLSFFSCPNVSEEDILSKQFRIIERLVEYRPEVFENLKEDEEDEMKKVKVCADSKKGDSRSPQRRFQPHHFQLNAKDDPRKTIFDQVGLKRHSLSQAAMKTSCRYERFDSAGYLATFDNQDVLAGCGDNSAASFRSSMPIVASHVIKDFGSRDRVLLGNSDSANQILRHPHHHPHNRNVHDFPANNNSKRITFDQLAKFRSSNFSTGSSGDGGSNTNLLLEKAHKLDNTTNVNNSKDNLEDCKTLVRTDVDNYVRFRDMKDARRKFFESDNSLRSNYESAKNPFMGLRPKSSAALTNIETSSLRHSIDVSHRHQSFLSQLSYEPKLMKEEEKERRKISPRSDTFDKRFSASMTTVNGNENNAMPGHALRNYDDPHKVDDWRTIRSTDQYSLKKTKISVPIKHHRKRESLDSGFDMRMEDTTASYPASEDSMNSASSPDSYNRCPLFSPPHTKNMNVPSSVANWFLVSSPKPYHNPKHPPSSANCINSAMYSSMSVSSTTFSYQTTRRKFSTIPRGTTFPMISIFQLSEEKACPTVQTLDQITEELHSTEVDLIGYAMAIMKSHEGNNNNNNNNKVDTLLSDNEIKKSSPESPLPATFLSSYTPKFLGDPILLSCFHVKEFFPNFFIDKFPWQPMSRYSFDERLINNETGSHDNTLTEDNCDDDDDDEKKDNEQLDYPEIRKKLDDLTRKQVEQLNKLRDFLEENLKNSKEKRNQVYLKIQSKLTEKEQERCQNFSNESDKILRLLVLLSQRISKHHDEEKSKFKNTDGNSSEQAETRDSSTDGSATDSEKNSIDQRHNKPKLKPNLKLTELESRLADARNLKDSIEKRGNILHEILSLRNLEVSDIREFFNSTGETFVLSLILLWTLERNKMASEFLLGLEKLAEDEMNLTKQRDRKKKRKNKVSEIVRRDDIMVDGGDDDDDDDNSRL